MKQVWVSGVLGLSLSLVGGDPGLTQDAQTLQRQFVQEMAPEFRKSCANGATADGSTGPEQSFAVSFCNAVAIGVSRCLANQLQQQNQLFSRMSGAIAAGQDPDNKTLMPSDVKLQEMTFGCIQSMIEAAQPTWDTMFPFSP
jgi:hypothetical protein